eukprot:XP_011604916.1 PREDICTED: uncharacterized protein LOC105416834 [Takifugu rubripes]
MLEPPQEPSECLRLVPQKFATTMMRNIICSFVSEMAAPGPSDGGPGFAQALAEDLASAVVEAALMEASGGKSGEGRLQRSDSSLMDGAPNNSTSQSGRVTASSDLDPYNQTQIPNDSQPPSVPLSQLGLPTVGSLDYPDAPPTTPLSPELERSQTSFARKLKGGLAKVFLPSPPPPTPKDNEDDCAGVDPDLRVELMEHLMHSLTTWDSYEERPHGGAKIEALAEAVSGDIIDTVLRAGEQISDYSVVEAHLQAQRMAETIIASSLDEVRMLV